MLGAAGARRRGARGRGGASAAVAGSHDDRVLEHGGGGRRRESKTTAASSWHSSSCSFVLLACCPVVMQHQPRRRDVRGVLYEQYEQAWRIASRYDHFSTIVCGAAASSFDGQGTTHCCTRLLLHDASIGLPTRGARFAVWAHCRGAAQAHCVGRSLLAPQKNRNFSAVPTETNRGEDPATSPSPRSTAPRRSRPRGDSAELVAWRYVHQTGFIIRQTQHHKGHPPLLLPAGGDVEPARGETSAARRRADPSASSPCA